MCYSFKITGRGENQSSTTLRKGQGNTILVSKANIKSNREVIKLTSISACTVPKFLTYTKTGHMDMVKLQRDHIQNIGSCWWFLCHNSAIISLLIFFLTYEIKLPLKVYNSDNRRIHECKTPLVRCLYPWQLGCPNKNPSSE